MQSIKDVKNLKGKEILLRLDLNVPVKDGEILNDFRIKKALPTVKFLKDQGAKIIILGHLGREKTDTFKSVFEYLKKEMEISFIKDPLSSDADMTVSNMEEGDVVLVENLRQNEGEINNDEGFSKQLSRLGEIYVNEAFSNSHREHSSIVGIPKFLPSYSGILFDQEVKLLSESFKPQKPSLFILGGNKLRTKLPFIEKSLNIADNVFVGGALVNNFFKAQGLNVGESFVAPSDFDLTKVLNSDKVIFPVDVVVQNKADEILTKKPNEVLDDEKILDAGRETVSQLKDLINKSKFVLFNGPLGDYEKGFGQPTKELIKAIAESTVTSIIGGGDSTALVNKLGIEKDFTFVSTGGGAMLEFLINETLPGIQALEN